MCKENVLLKNKACNSTYVLMLKGVNFSNQVLTLSFRVKGNKVSHTISLDVVISLVVRHRTWKSLM